VSPATSQPAVREGALVLYRGRPARVVALGEKIELALEGGQGQRVRPKDIALLHPGPVRALSDLGDPAGEAEAAWELLAGTTTTLREVAELAYGDYTPAAAWAAWRLVANGLLFDGTPEAVRARGGEEVAAERARRAERAREEQARTGFAERVRAGAVGPEDARLLVDVERLADGRSGRSRVLRELGREETPEGAHRLLLRLGHWRETVNPHPSRLGVPLTEPAIEVPVLPEEPRLDLTGLPAFAIDDEDNRDPDDALSLDGERVWVHVADVAALVGPDTAIDLEARARGANLYLPERTVPMLPIAVTERLGLGLEEVSPALSFGFALAGDGTPGDLRVERSWVRVTRVSYAAAERRLDEEPFRTLYAHALRYQARRVRAGAVLLDLPEVKVRVEGDGVVVTPLPRLRSRDLVTEAMLMAGEAVGRLALDRVIALPFATQSPPDRNDRPTGLAGMFAFRKLLKRTQLRGVAQPHAGLGLAVYCQVTSPLRRYLDLVAHQQLRAWTRGDPLLDYEQLLERVGATEAVVGPLRQAERASNRHWTLVSLQRNPGWRGEGVVVERNGARATVLIPALALEVSVHLDRDVPLDGTVTVTLTGVDLPSLAAHFVAAE
jgi:exoribonuclease-2